MLIKNVKEQLCQTINYLGKTQFYQPWRGRFTRSNSRLTTRYPNISNGTLYMHLELGKAVKSPSQDEAAFPRMWRFYCVESSFSNDDPK